MMVVVEKDGRLKGRVQTMAETNFNKDKMKRDMISALEDDSTVEKIVIFGSFITSDQPHDLDVAIFSTSHADYLTQAMSFRRRLRSIARIIPLDIVPVSMPIDTNSSFLREIDKGEIIYEKRH
jgi:predicted nucleotidyltransferase